MNYVYITFLYLVKKMQAILSCIWWYSNEGWVTPYILILKVRSLFKLNKHNTHNVTLKFNFQYYNTPLYMQTEQKSMDKCFCSDIWIACSKYLGLHIRQIADSP